MSLCLDFYKKVIYMLMSRLPKLPYGLNTLKRHEPMTLPATLLLQEEKVSFEQQLISQRHLQFYRHFL